MNIFVFNFRKHMAADDHYRLTLLKKIFVAWLHFVSLQHQEMALQQEQNQTKFKMAAFLEAAASGRLWEKEEDAQTSVSEGPQSYRSTVVGNPNPFLFLPSFLSFFLSSLLYIYSSL